MNFDRSDEAIRIQTPVPTTRPPTPRPFTPTTTRSPTPTICPPITTRPPTTTPRPPPRPPTSTRPPSPTPTLKNKNSKNTLSYDNLKFPVKMAYFIVE